MYQYLKESADNPELLVHKLIIDDCGMKDSQFATILRGIKEQGSSIYTISYSNNELGPESIKELNELAPHLQELQLVNY